MHGKTREITSDRALTPRATADASGLIVPHSVENGPLRVVGIARMRASHVTIALLTAVLCATAGLGYAIIAGHLWTDSRSFIDNHFLRWSWAKFIQDTPVPAQIYRFHILDAFQHHLDARYDQHFPFAYPPTFLLVIWPLGLLSRFAAYGAFLGTSLALYLVACWHRPWGALNTGLALIAPSTVVTLFAAQNALLLAALMIGGCRLMDKRPVLAGVLFGVMSFKPQFGLLLPLALVSAREWRGFAAATATVLAGVLASGMAFGWATWAALPTALTQLARFVAPIRAFSEGSPTVTATLRLFGAGPAIAQEGQLAAAVLAGGVVFLCFRRGFSPLPIAALLVGTFLTTPYAFYYDLPIVSYAVLAVGIDARDSRVALRIWEVAVLVLAILLPYLLFFSPFGLPYGGPVLALLFVLIVRRCFTADCRPMQSAMEPSTRPILQPPWDRLAIATGQPFLPERGA